MRGRDIVSEGRWNPRLRLAVFAGVSSLVVTGAFSLFFQILMLSRGNGLGQAHFYLPKYVAAPLAGATLLGVLLSRRKNSPRISVVRTITLVAVTPLVGLCTFIVTYLICLAFYSHYTPLVVYSILALAHSSAVLAVRWCVNAFYRVARP